MKYQNFAIIFVIIVLPLSMVLSYYIQNQTDTLVLQTTYQTKLNDSTYDAISAYQINSLNTQRTTGESIKSYVLASVNTFFTTLATNFGMSSASKSRLQNYVPAILFTTYDGYYIYSPIKTPQVAIKTSDGTAVITSEKDVVYAKSGTGENQYRVSDSTAEEISKYKTATINGRYSGQFTTDASSAKEEYNYMLKPFIYYSAQYADNNYDIVASYTLDNYVTLYGKLNNKEFTKSGYLIDPSKINLSGTLLVKVLAKQGTSATDLSKADIQKYEDVYKHNSDSASNQHNNVRYLAVDVNSSDAYQYINNYEYGNDKTFSDYGNGNIYSPNKVVKKDSSGRENTTPIRNQTGDEIIKDTLEIDKLINDSANYPGATGALVLGSNSNISVTYNNVTIEDEDAKEYYIKAYFFSRWVQDNLSDVKAESMKQEYLQIQNMTAETKLAYTDFSGDETKIFAINSTNNNPESQDSDFVQHKRNVIKNSIQYNLNSAISTFNDTYYNSEVSYRLPVLRDEDWENVLNNVSIVTFLQGMPCGTKRFNSYSVVKSNNNNTSVDIENMYFVNKNVYNNGKDNYHMYDCPDLGSDGSNDYVADQSAEFKYDAKRILAKVKDADQTIENLDNIVCLYDDSTNTYYVANKQDGEIQIGDEIPAENVQNYNGHDLTTLPNGSEEIYLYDHKNLGCYTCIISRNYNSVVKYYKGDVRRTFTTDDGELIVEMQSNQYEYYRTGESYTGTVDASKMISQAELNKRKSAVYTYLAKIRNGLYKTNDYVNR